MSKEKRYDEMSSDKIVYLNEYVVHSMILLKYMAI